MEGKNAALRLKHLAPRSDNRQHLRQFFEVNAESIAAAALSRLAREGKFEAQRARKAMQELGIDTEKIDPAIA